MSSSLFQQQSQKPDARQIINTIMQGNPETIANQMYQTNPQFKKFVDENKNLPLEQLAQKFNIPLR